MLRNGGIVVGRNQNGMSPFVYIVELIKKEKVKLLLSQKTRENSLSIDHPRDIKYII